MHWCHREIINLHLFISSTQFKRFNITFFISLEKKIPCLYLRTITTDTQLLINFFLPPNFKGNCAWMWSILAMQNFYSDHQSGKAISFCHFFQKFPVPPFHVVQSAPFSYFLFLQRRTCFVFLFSWQNQNRV